MAFARAPANSPENILPPWHSMDILVQDPVRVGECVRYRVVLVAKTKPEELHCIKRRYREFNELYKMLKSIGGSEANLPGIPGKQAFGRFNTNFIEDRRKGLENLMERIKERPNLVVTPEFLGFMGLFGGGGYLRKLGAKTIALRDPFKLRWFKVENTDLEYYEKLGGTRKGKIPLKTAKLVDCEIYPNSFCIIGPDLPRTYVISAETPSDLVHWKLVLEQITGKARQTGLIDGILDDSEKSVLTFSSNVTVADVGLRDFSMECVVGIGSFGKVLKVKHNATGKHYAMKVLNKDQVVRNKMVNHTNAEREILEQAAHPFIVALHFSFQTSKQVVFVMDFLSGGELFFHLQREKRFSEERSKIYTASIALAISHLHGLDVIYRDLKPENLVLDSKGYVVLTDFGLAKVNVTGSTFTFCGTPEYMAPELIKKKGHTQAVDWWSLGIFLYEMVCGLPPFYTQSVSQMYQLILKKPLEFPSFTSPSLRTVLGKLLERNPEKRVRSLKELQRYQFFSDVDFGALLLRKTPAPWVPDLADTKDTKYFDREFTKQPPILPGGEDDDSEDDIASEKFSKFLKSKK